MESHNIQMIVLIVSDRRTFPYPRPDIYRQPFLTENCLTNYLWYTAALYPELWKQPGILHRNAPTELLLIWQNDIKANGMDFHLMTYATDGRMSTKPGAKILIFQFRGQKLPMNPVCGFHRQSREFWSLQKIISLLLHIQM